MILYFLSQGQHVCAVTEKRILLLVEHCGELSEWLKEHAWKACVRETVPRVRISHSPPLFLNLFLFQVGPQRFGLAQWSLVNPVRSGRKQR